MVFCLPFDLSLLELLEVSINLINIIRKKARPHACAHVRTCRGF